MHATPKPDYRLGRDRILRRQADFAVIKSQGRRVRSSTLTLNWMTGWSEGTLSAIIVPKAVGNAVTRNRIRRRLREIYRHVRPQLLPGSATVWIASRMAANASLATLARDLLYLCHRANLLDSAQTIPEPVRSYWKLAPGHPKFSGQETEP